MDFKLFIAVVKRYKRVVIGGTILAVVLSVLSYGMPGLKGGKPTVIPRGSEVFQGQAELLISQAGFPYGRAVDQYTPGSQTSPSEPIGDENYMANLSSVYAAVANSTSIQQKVAKQSGVAVCPSLQPCGTVMAAEVDDISDGVPLPPSRCSKAILRSKKRPRARLSVSASSCRYSRTDRPPPSLRVTARAFRSSCCLP